MHFWKSYRSIQKGLTLFFLVFLSAGLAVSCEEDESELPQKIVIYKLLCPNGVTACYQACEASVGNGDNIVQVDEKEAYDSCASTCDVNCDTSFLYMMVN